MFVNFYILFCLWGYGSGVIKGLYILNLVINDVCWGMVISYLSDLGNFKIFNNIFNIYY